MKKTKLLSVITAAILASSFTVLAENIDVSYDVSVNVDGKPVASDSYGPVKPFISDGTTYLPLRSVSELIGWGINWDGASSSVTLTPPTPTEKPTSSLPEGITLTEDGTLGDLLVVVDMQNVYLEDQPWACTTTSACTDNIIKMMDSVDNVVFTEYIAPTNPTGCWVTYNEQYKDINSNEWYNAIVDELLPFTEKYPVYDKSTYSSYGNEEFKELTMKADRLIITGVMAECCVLATVIDAIDTGVPLVYVTDACSGSSKEYEESTEKIVSFASPLHTTLMTTQEFIDSKAN